VGRVTQKALRRGQWQASQPLEACFWKLCSVFDAVASCSGALKVCLLVGCVRLRGVGCCSGASVPPSVTGDLSSAAAVLSLIALHACHPGGTIATGLLHLDSTFAAQNGAAWLKTGKMSRLSWHIIRSFGYQTVPPPTTEQASTWRW
jgi:hypothetical protein